jgi:hypothetical protein
MLQIHLTIHDKNLIVQATARRNGARMDRNAPHRIGFFLIPEFPIYAVIPATEALRIANQTSRRNISTAGCSTGCGGWIVTASASEHSTPAPSRWPRRG